MVTDGGHLGGRRWSCDRNLIHGNRSGRCSACYFAIKNLPLRQESHRFRGRNSH